MKDIIKFLDTHYENALKLVSDFDITKSKKWDASDYVQELLVQVGHVYTVLDQDDDVKESKRKIDNLGDELADVLLQLINLARIMNIDMYEITSLKSYKSSNVNGLSILMGQLAEVIMENNSARFKKNRDGFNTSYDFIKDRIFKLFIITYNIGKEHKLNLIKEFSLMCDDANGFLTKFRKGETNFKEYIDIYDEEENLLGYCEKELAHKLGYWHRVFGCLAYNSKTKKVFMQIKNPNHNKVHKKELLEITAGGHLISGETVENGTREFKEETGFDINYKDLTFVEYRKCNKIINKNYKIREFQYYYIIDLDKQITDFIEYDRNEVIGFVELKITDLIKLLNGKKREIKGIRENGKEITIDINSLDKDFIKNGLYISLLKKLNIQRGIKVMDAKLRRLFKLTNKAKKNTPEEFYFDNGQVEKYENFDKDKLKYSVIKLKTNVDEDNYLVFLQVIDGKKSITQMLVKKFKSNRGTEKYYKELCDMVEKNTNQDIIDTCYKDKFSDMPKISVIKRIFG